MNTGDFNAFLTVAESFSFTKAAAYLGLSQPTVTARIKKLEKAYGVTLFERSNTGVQLTNAGTQLRRYAHGITELAGGAQKALSGHHERMSGLHVRAESSLLAHRLVPLIEYMHLRHPQAELALRALEDDPITTIRRAKADCVFFMDVPYRAPDVQSSLLCPEPLALIAAPEHPLESTPELDMRELSDETLLCAQRDSGYQALFEKLIADSAGALPRVLTLGTIGAVKHGVSQGLGLALVPKITVSADLHCGKLRQIACPLSFSAFSQVAWHLSIASDDNFQELLTTAMKVVAEQSAGVEQEVPVGR